MMSEPLRVLMYSPDSIGLGHMRRNATIAAELVRQAPGASVALLVGSGAGAFFAVPKGIDTIKLPSVQKIAADTWEPRSLNLSVDHTCALRAGIICDVVATMRPHLLLVDHLPMGVCGDLVPALDYIATSRFPTRVMLGLRDILDEPTIIRSRWASQGHYEFIARHYNAILIYGDPEVYPTADVYDLRTVLPHGVIYAGYVCDSTRVQQDVRADPESTRALEGLAAWQEGERIVIANGGGGHDAFPMLSLTMKSLRLLDDDPTLRSIVIAGPLMPAEDRAALEQLARGLKRTRLLAWTADCLDYLVRADVSLVMGGYNSALEALSTTSRVVMMPRKGASAEQSIRARMLAARGHVTCIDPATATPEALVTAIADAVRARPRQSGTAMFWGSTNAARALIARCHRDASVPTHWQPVSGRSRHVTL